jgi:hypothetical protein
LTKLKSKNFWNFFWIKSESVNWTFELETARESRDFEEVPRQKVQKWKLDNRCQCYKTILLYFTVAIVNHTISRVEILL